MKKVANLNLIQWLFDNQSGYRISQDTGVSQSVIQRYMSGDTDLRKMQFGVAIQLTEYAKKLQKEKS